MSVVVAIELQSAILNRITVTSRGGDEKSIAAIPRPIVWYLLHIAESNSIGRLAQACGTVVDQTPAGTQEQIGRVFVAPFDCDGERIAIHCVVSRGKSERREQRWIGPNGEVQASAAATTRPQDRVSAVASAEACIFRNQITIEHIGRYFQRTVVARI